jgi:uncharacterized protein
MISLFAFSLRAEASEVLWDQYEVPATRQKDRLLDNADLLTDGEESLLLDKLNDVSNKWNCNVVVLTVDDHSGPIQDYADDYFDYNGFGADYNGDGILFMLSMSDREWAISTAGRAQWAFTDYGQEKMMDEMMDELREGDYYEAFEEYVMICDRYLEMYDSGTAYDVGVKPPKTQKDIIGYIFGSIIGGLIIALIPILKMKSDLKTVKMQANANAYEGGKGISLRVKEDRFVRKALSKTPIPKDTGSRSGGGGGSSIHTSSSGSSHGGSHGHF